MIKVKDGYVKLIGTTASGSASRVLLSNGGDFGLHTGRNNEADKIVRTDTSGYIQAGLINTTSSNMETTAINRIYCSNDGYIRYKTPANFFSTLANDSNQLSITVGSQNRKLTVAYATNSDTVDGYHANELFTDLSNSGNNLSVTIGETTKKLTVDYASNASSATKLTSSAGSAILPIYFSNGKPVVCSFQYYYNFNNNNIPYIKLFTLKITQAYINTPITFNIKGRSGREAFIAIKFSNGSTADPTITYFKGWGGYSGYYTRLRIYKTDTSTWEVWKMSQAEGYDLGYVWDMQVPGGITFTWNNTTSSTEPTYTTYTNCTIETLSVNISGNADTASKLGTSTIGSGVKPIYLNAGTATASSSTVGDIAKPMYLNAGTMTALSATVGSSSLPVYLNAGTLTTCSGTLGVSITGNAATASKLGTSTIGAINVPIYLNEGTPTVVNLNSTANNLINSLSTGTSTPTDSDYYISQYVGGGTTTTTYHRRPTSALYSYIKNKAEGTWKISITGNAATATKLTTSAGNATLPIYFSDGKPIACTASSIFSDLSNDGNNISITVAGQNRKLTINYTNSAGYTKRLYANSSSSLITDPGYYSLAYSRFQAGVSNVFPTTNNANGVITAHLHDGNYFAQIGLSSDGRMYYRTMMGQTLDAGVTWHKVAFTSDIPTIPSISVSNSGSGNAVTSITASGHTLTINKGSTFSLSGHAHSVLTFQAGTFSNKTYNGTSTQTINVPTTGAHIGLGNVQNTAFYKRSTTVNGTPWNMAGTDNKAAFTIYAPTTAGTSGQVLVSSGGGAPSWKTLSIKDSDVSWSTTSLKGKLSIMEMAYSNVHSSNKLAFGKVEGITLEYSQNGGSSWVELTEDTWKQKKLNLISGISSSISTGNRTTDNTANDRLRITLNAVAMGIYTWPSKLLININTNVTAEPYATVKVEYSRIGNPTSYTVYGTYNISGWSGWNSIPLTSLSNFGGGSTQTNNVQNIRLTFANNNANKYLIIQDIYMIGQTNWANPSNMSKTGHLYSYNYNQDMILPESLSLGGVNNLNKKISYLGPEGHLYITANNINSAKTGGIVIKTTKTEKTTKNSIVSQILLESDTDSKYGKVTITGDLCIGGRKSNTTAFISSDDEYNMYISVQGKTLLVCNSSENSIRCGYKYADTINLGTTSHPWKAVYSNQLILKNSNCTNKINPASGDYTYTLPTTPGILMTTGMIWNYVPKYAIYTFEYKDGDSTYTLTRIGGNGQFFKIDANLSDPYYQQKWSYPGIFIYPESTAWENKDSIIIFGSGPSINEGTFVSKDQVRTFYPNHVVICESSKIGNNGTTDYGYSIKCVDILGNYQSSGSGRIYCIGQY